MIFDLLFKIRREEIPVEVTLLECHTCHQEFAPTDMEERNFKKAYDIYRTRKRLLFPKEIAAIRSKYDLSRRALSRLLGWGKITVHNYEAGALQDETHNRKASNSLLIIFAITWRLEFRSIHIRKRRIRKLGIRK